MIQKMETLDCIRTRRSVRKYLDKAPPMDLVGQVLEAGRMAPTSGNLQNYKIILVKDKGLREAIAEACNEQYWMASAPVHLVVVAEPQRARQFYYERGEKFYSVQNCANVAMSMMLAAWDQGLGTCWVGAFDEEKLRGVLGIPDYVWPQAVITLGYPAEKPGIPDRFKLWDMVFLNGWEKRIANIHLVMREPSVVMEKKLKEGKEKVAAHAKRILKKVKKRTQEVAKKVKNKRKK